MPVYSVAHPTEEQRAARQQLTENAARFRDRKRLNRRKIIVGAAVLTEALHDPEVNRVMRQVLQSRITRPVDRAVIADLLD